MGGLLAIENLTLTLGGSDGRRLPVLENISLDVDHGECLGIAGESGSGKSVLALSLMGLVPSRSILERSGAIRLDGRELLGLDEDSLRPLRGARMAMVFQEPMTAMNPLLTIGEQVAEVVQAHLPALKRGEVEARVERAMRRAGFPDPTAHLGSYPHQLSGGMRQRAMLAMALVMDPELIIADEPTTALDAGLQVQLLSELRHDVKDGGHALIFISHDLGVIRSIADRLAVLYAGHLVEVGTAADLLAAPAHPYTAALVAALPRLVIDRKLPKPIPGHLPAPDRKPAGCVFSDRCPKVRPACAAAVPPLRGIGPRRLVKCLFPDEALAAREPGLAQAAMTGDARSAQPAGRLPG